MNTFIGAGGSGALVLESLIHLCAAGLGPNRIAVLGIDPDGANGNLKRVRELLKAYGQLRHEFAGKLGAADNSFGTEFEVFSEQAGNDELRVWTPALSSQTLADIVQADLLQSAGVEPDLLKLFFTDMELHMPLKVGFRGHTSVGAAAFSLIEDSKALSPWNDVLESLRQQVARPEGSNVVLAGSVFGGTGASSFHPIARFLRESFPHGSGNKADRNPQLRIGVVALTPYFQFARAGAEDEIVKPEHAARSEDFPVKARAAAQYYEHLRTSRDWPFDAMFWIGDKDSVEFPFAEGSETQANPAHLVDLLAAYATLEFFAVPPRDGSCRYSGPRQDNEPAEGTRNLVEWEDLPHGEAPKFAEGHAKQEIFRLALTGAVHTEFFQHLFSESLLRDNPSFVPWYRDNFADRNQTLLDNEAKGVRKKLADYFTNFLFPWCSQVSMHQGARLFNRSAFRTLDGNRVGFDLTQLGNLAWPGNIGDANQFQVDTFIECLEASKSNSSGAEPCPTYLALLMKASEAFIQKRYSATVSPFNKTTDVVR